MAGAKSILGKAAEVSLLPAQWSEAALEARNYHKDSQNRAIE